MNGPIVDGADPAAGDIAALIARHLAESAAAGPSESDHALDAMALRSPDILFFVARIDGALAGMGALKLSLPDFAEIKSMRTVDRFRRRGVAAAILQRLIAEARQRGAHALCLETGTMAEFAAARQFYARYGFRECAPFAEYREDPNSVFLRLPLDAGR